MNKKGLHNYIIIDTETTGFSFRYHRVLEIGALKVVNGKIVEEMQALVKTSPYVPRHISKFTGITTEMVQNDGRDPDQTFTELRDFIGKDVFVGHNVYFDFNFLNAEFSRYNLPILENNRICTCQLSKRAMPYLPNHKLETVKNHFAMDIESHRALTDSYVCFEIMTRYPDFVRIYDTPIDRSKYTQMRTY